MERETLKRDEGVSELETNEVTTPIETKLKSLPVIA
jgi:hypothetical protein